MVVTFLTLSLTLSIDSHDRAHERARPIAVTAAYDIRTHMEIILLIIAILLVLLGLLGTVLPALPGAPLVFGGLLLLAWLDKFTHVTATNMWIIGGLTLLSFAVDFLATSLGATRAGASRLAVLGAVLGTLVGIFAGFIGVLILPFVGAVIGEYIARQDIAQAGRAGIGAWLGLIFGLAAKLAIVCVMIGIFLIAYLA